MNTHTQKLRSNKSMRVILWCYSSVGADGRAKFVLYPFLYKMDVVTHA